MPSSLCRSPAAAVPTPVAPSQFVSAAMPPLALHTRLFSPFYVASVFVFEAHLLLTFFFISASSTTSTSNIPTQSPFSFLVVSQR